MVPATSKLDGGFVIVSDSYWIILALDVQPDIAIRTAIGTNLLVILPPAISDTWRHNNRKAIHRKTGVILGIYGLVGSSLGVTLATRQKGEVNIRNGEQGIFNLAPLPFFTGTMGFAVTRRVPYWAMLPLEAGVKCKMEGSPCLN